MYRRNICQAGVVYFDELDKITDILDEKCQYYMENIFLKKY
jgi:hypothetical protein